MLRVQSLGPSTSVAWVVTGEAMAAERRTARRRAAFVFMRHLDSNGRGTETGRVAPQVTGSGGGAFQAAGVAWGAPWAGGPGPRPGAGPRRVVPLGQCRMGSERTRAEVV